MVVVSFWRFSAVRAVRALGASYGKARATLLFPANLSPNRRRGDRNSPTRSVELVGILYTVAVTVHLTRLGDDARFRQLIPKVEIFGVFVLARRIFHHEFLAGIDENAEHPVRRHV